MKGFLQVFDDDKSGKLDFVEYMMAVQSTQLKSPEEKLTWIFRMYDKVEKKLFYTPCHLKNSHIFNYRTFPAPSKSRSFVKCLSLCLK